MSSSLPSSDLCFFNACKIFPDRRKPGKDICFGFDFRKIKIAHLSIRKLNVVVTDADKRITIRRSMLNELLSLTTSHDTFVASTLSEFVRDSHLSYLCCLVHLVVIVIQVS